ncbi:phage tail tape measure protein [Listeria booriae]|uniref:phage tail tape measure protein n=1 Tax=Listeria booriae TaxID=1552123 RepID=UPI002893254C|nr:phage tail tape measure protein [Listeria booriae]
MTIGGDVSGLANSLKQAQREMDGLTNNINKLGDAVKPQGTKLDRLGKSMVSVGAVMTATFGAASIGMVKGIGAAVGAASEFESAWAGVEKTVDGNASQLKALQKELLTVTKAMPQSTKEIFGVAEAAGQLGIERKNIAGFTKTMLDLGVATNMTSEEAATDLARLANITQMPQKNFGRLGATIVDLGNHFATTEKEITSMGLRLAGQGNQVGMSEAQILGLATAMSSVGIEAEAGGTAMSTVMKKIGAAVDNGGSKLSGFAELAGMSAGEFKTAWKKDAAGAIDAVIHGLSKSSKEGENLTEVLGRLGIKGIRESDVLLRLSGNADLLTNALKTANNGWRENTALLNEANKRYGTFESQVGITKKVMAEFARSIGTPLKDVIGKLLQAINSVVIAVTGFINKFNEASPTLAKVAAVMTLVVTGLTMLGAAIGAVLVAIGGFIHIIEPALPILKKMGTLLGRLRPILLALTSPIGIVVGVILALGAAFYVLYKDSEKFRNGVNKVFSSIANSAKKMGASMKPAISGIKSLFKGNWADGATSLKNILPDAVIVSLIRSITAIKDALASMSIPWKKLINNFETGFNKIKTIFSGIKSLFKGDWAEGASLLHNLLPDSAIVALIRGVTVIRNAIGLLQKSIAFLQSSVSRLMNYLKTSMNIGAIFAGALDIVTANFVGFINILGSLFTGLLFLLTGDWRSAWNEIAQIPSEYVNSLKNVFAGIQKMFGGIIGVAKDFGNLLVATTQHLDALSGGALSRAIGGLTTLGKAFLSLGTSLKNGFLSVINNITSFFSNMGTAFANAGSTFSNIGGGIVTLLDRMGGAFGVIGGVASIVVGILSKVALAFLGLTGGLGLAVALLISFVSAWAKTGKFNADGITEVFNNLSATIDSVATYLTSNLPKFIEIGTDLITKFVEGITNAIPKITEQATSIINKFSSTLSTMLPKIIELGITLLTNLIEGIVKAIPTIVNTVITLINTWVSTVTTLLPMILNAGLQILTALIDGITKAMPQIIEAAITILTALFDGIMSALPLILDLGIQLITMLVSAIIAALPTLLFAGITIITSLLNVLIENLPMILSAGIQILMALIDGIIQILPQLISAAITLLMALIGALIDNLPKIIDAGIQLVMALISGLIQILPKLIDAGIKLLMAIIKALIDNLPKIIDAGVKLILALIDGLIKILPQLIKAGWKLITELLKAIIKFAPQILNAGVQLIWALIKGIGSLLGQLLAKGAELIGKLISKLWSYAGQLVTKGAELIGKLISGIWSKAGEVASKVGEIGEKMIEKIKGFFDGMKNAGKHVIDGLVKGITDKVDAVKTACKNVGDAITGKIKGILGIHSPSRVMRDEVGKFIPLGLVKGIDSQMRALYSAADRMVDAATPDMGAIQTGLKTNMSSDINGAVSASINANTPSNAWQASLGARIDALGDRLDGMAVQIDGKTAGRVMAPRISEQEAQQQRQQFKALGKQY